MTVQKALGALLAWCAMSFLAATALGISLVLCFLLLVFRRLPRLHVRRTSAGALKVAYLRTNVLAGLSTGGSVSHTSGFIAGLHHCGHRPIVLSSTALADLDPDLPPVRIIAPPFASYRLPITMQVLAFNIHFIWKAMKLLRNEHPDVICQRNTGLDMCGCLVAQAYGVPFVLEYNSSTFWHTRRGRRVKFSGLLRLVEAVNLRSADRIAVVSRVGKEYLMQRGIPASKIFINPNGADIRLFSPEVAPGAIRRERGFGNAVIAGFSGVYGPWHGIESLCAAIPLVARVNPEIIFLFIGDRELEKRVKDALNGATQLPRMEFIQDLPHQDVPRYLADCDILVSPHVNMPDGSPFFGSPVKLFEYMAMGKSIVASSVGQIGEILMPEVDALLVKPNHPEEIAAAILRLAADHGLREKLGRSARALCESAYAWEHNTERFVEQCHRIASRRSTRSSTG